MTSKLKQKQSMVRGKPQGALGDATLRTDYRINVNYSKSILKEPGIHFKKIRVENTNACKYACKMCPREKMSRRTGIMPPEDYQLVLDRVKEYVKETHLPQPFISDFFLHGYGEPLLDPMLATKSAMVAEQFPAAFTFIYTTLGVRRPKSYLKNLLVEGKLKTIAVSHYGFQEHTYNAVQHDGDFHTAQENLKYLATLNKSLGSPCAISLQLLMPDTQDVINKDSEEKKAFQAFMSFLEPLGVKLHGIKLHNHGNGRNYFAPDTSVCSVVKGTRQEHFNVSWDLKVLPCCFDYNGDIVYGDLREQSIFEIYHGEKYQKFIASHRAGNLDDYPLCKGCNVQRTMSD